MDSDDDNEQLIVNEEVPHYSWTENSSGRRTYFGTFQNVFPRKTIAYIQYCFLRVPLLLVYDYLFTEQFASAINSFVQYSIEAIDRENVVVFKPVSYVLHSYFFQSLIYLNLILSIPVLGLILLTILLLCSDRRLVIFYSYTISFLVIYFYYQINRLPNIQINMFILQFLLSYVYIQMLNIRSHVSINSIQTYLCHLAPVIFLASRYLLPLHYSIALLNMYYFVWTLIHLSELFIYQQNLIVSLLRIRFLNEVINLYENFGLQTLVNHIQQHIRTGTLLKIFWLTKVIVIPLGIRATYTHPFLANSTTIKNETIDLNTTNDSALNYTETLTKTIYFTTLFYGTETFFTLISLACLVSHGMQIMAHRLFRLLHLWNEEVEQLGTIIGVMFFLLLFQSNLTRLDLNRRHIPLIKAFSLLIIAVLHFLHAILEPQLLKVAMQTMTTKIAFEQNDDPSTEHTEKKLLSYFSAKILRSFAHRYVYTCVAILIFFILYIIFLWHVTTVSTWLLAITAFSLELIVRLIASLAQYTLYVLDAHNCLTHADSFDENIFRIKAVTSCFEFILGVFLLFNGLYILCFEARGALRAFMLAIHAHLNIIKNLRRGWQILRNRKSAWDNVNQLPLATEEQIQSYNDICSICHNQLTMGNTCITPCSHLFHQKCLQKAFYATQNCALCSRPIVIEKREHQD